MDVRIKPNKLKGTVAAPASKSAAHRALIAASLAAGGTSRLTGLSFSQDILATIDAMRALGVVVCADEQMGSAQVVGIGGAPTCARILCRESGSTLRFLLPIAAALGVKATFEGKGRLPQRPVRPLSDVMREHGVQFDTDTGLPLTIGGQLTGGQFRLPGNVSSQFITGLLFALPLLAHDSRIVLTSPLQSKGYVDLTIGMLRHFGIAVVETENGYAVAGAQQYAPHDLRIEGDYSNAAFWLCAAALGSDLACTGLSQQSLQGDRAILSVLEQFGARVGAGEVVSVDAQPMKGIAIDAAQIPDLVPILAITACGAVGDTTIYNAARLRIKECDRLAAVRDCITRLGGAVEEFADKLIVHGTGRLRGGCVDGYNDHRIVMAAAIAATICDEPVTICGAQAVEKSYGNFFEVYQSLGGMVNGI